MTSHLRRLRVGSTVGRHLVEVPPAGAVSVDGDTVQVAHVEKTTYQVTINDRRYLVHVTARDDRSWVFADGHVFTLDLAPDRPSRSAAAGAPLLSAPMPATVRAVLVSAGQRVRQGDTLVLLEAMKMELALRAPRDGQVEGISCREGDLVQPGAPLVTLVDNG